MWNYWCCEPVASSTLMWVSKWVLLGNGESNLVGPTLNMPKKVVLKVGFLVGREDMTVIIPSTTATPITPSAGRGCGLGHDLLFMPFRANVISTIMPAQKKGRYLCIFAI